MTHRILFIALLTSTALGCGSSTPSMTLDGARPDTGRLDVAADAPPTDTAPGPADRPDTGANPADGSDAATCSGVDGSLPSTLRYLAPGCGASAPAPICASNPMDACNAGYLCGCDGRLHATCDRWLNAPWAYFVPLDVPDGGGDGTSCDPNARNDGGSTSADASDTGAGQ